MSGFAEEFAQHDDQWAEDQETAATRGRMPDGPHQAQIVLCRVEQNAQSLRWSWVLGYQNDQGKVRNWYNLDHEVGRSIAAADSKKLGYEGPLSGLQEWCESEAALNILCEIKVETKPGNQGRDFTNVYLNRVLGMGEAGQYGPNAFDADGTSVAGGDSVPGPSDDDIPF